MDDDTKVDGYPCEWASCNENMTFITHMPSGKTTVWHGQTKVLEAQVGNPEVLNNPFATFGLAQILSAHLLDALIRLHGGLE